MGRPANPTPTWDPDRKVWVVRITMPKPADWPADKEAPRRPHDLPGIREDQPERAKAVAKIVNVRVRRGEGAPMAEGENVTTWVEQWIEDRERRGILSHKQDEGRLKNHVLDVIGPIAIEKVTRDDIERLVEALDAKVQRGDLAPKTASNVWTLVTSMFDDACRSKTRALRCRADNPTREVRGPDRGVDRSKTYLFPSEFQKLMAAAPDKVPLRFKELYATAVYSYCRAGELEALEWPDVDLEHEILSITKAVDRRNGEVKSTKSGESRRIPIEPNILPLLHRLHDQAKALAPPGKPVAGRVLWMPPADERAVRLREHLAAAGITRADLFTDNKRQKWITFHDLRRTALTWCAARGDDPLRIKQRAGHAAFATTEGYVVEAESLAAGFGVPFPELPPDLVGSFGSVSAFRIQNTPQTPRNLWSKGGSNP
jgi:integrase